MSVPSAIIIPLIVPRWLHASKCNFHICCNFSWARYACLQKTENLSISVLKTHWLLPVFGGFLSRTGHIRNGLTDCPGPARVFQPGAVRRKPGSSAPYRPRLFIVSNGSPLAPNWQPFLLLTKSKDEEKMSTMAQKVV